MIRKYAAGLLTFIFVMVNTSFPVLAAGTTYQDVDTRHWAYNSIQELTEDGVLVGMGGGIFEPNEQLSRAEIATVSNRITSLVQPVTGLYHKNGPIYYFDVQENQWFYSPIMKASKIGTMKGDGDGLFYPYRALTREEFITLLVRIEQQETAALALTPQQVNFVLQAFDDQGSISSWARPYVAYAVNQGLLTNLYTTLFIPQEKIDRAEMATLFERMLLNSQDGTVNHMMSSNQEKVPHTYQMVATAYGPSSESNGPWGSLDAMGSNLHSGIIAVDPNVIPLGSRVFVSGYVSPLLPKVGFYGIASDRGGAIKGNRVDIYIEASHQQLMNFGMQQVEVTVLP
ncbi:S-layer homology domain-containing protein [Rubeoparvulum massiliense]|uniref:S-layer homology domain-containing protein n=1 Tax=Rubeoparvulum massiliense TaxID=1631346 RepID=UPI00069E29BE|nr:S-layer homology domain-containing protein [Rubeoparvulum massiliense]